MSVAADPVEDAFQKAIQGFKADLQDETIYEEILTVNSIDQVYDATDKLQEEQGKKGHLRHLSKIEPYLTRLNEYADALGVFIQVKPDVLALVWGPIVLLLQWANALKISFDAIVNATAEIGVALPEFRRAVQLFGQNDHIADLLFLFFKDILHFYLLALKFFKLPRWKYLFEALWPKHRDKIRTVTTHIERHALLMRRELQFEHLQLEHEARVRDLAHIESTERSNLRQEYQRIKTDISPRAYNEELNRLQERACKGTERWLLKDSSFAEWLDASKKSTRLCWLQGMPGAGKTFLSGSLVNKARTTGRTLFAFLSYTHTGSTAISIFHSLIFQLAADDENLQTAICGLNHETLKSNIDVAVQVFSTLLAYTDVVYVIIDGLDEIDEIERRVLVKHLLTIIEDYEVTNLLLSSRRETDLKALVGDKAEIIRIDERNSGSIQAFIGERARDLFHERNFTPQEMVEIERWLAPLAFKSKGMFLYAKVVLDSLDFLNDMAEIENELKILPETLDAAYRRILIRVNSLRPLLKEKARKLLGWIASSPALLTVQEARRLLSIKINDKIGKTRLLAELGLDKVCGPIIEVIEDSIQFVHFTAKEYVSSPQIHGSISIRESTLSLATSCMAYLCQRHHEPNLVYEEIIENTLDGDYVLHGFVTTYWLLLLERCIQLVTDGIFPQELIELLEELVSERTNYEYSDDLNDEPPQELQALKDTSPDIYETVLRAIHFRNVCSTSQHSIREGSVLSRRDPLTISQTSILIHEAMNSLLNCKAEQHNGGCSCDKIRGSYGSRPFKCAFLFCESKRWGFESRSARNSHEKYHDRPWKCNVSTCEFANGGFLSKKMRNDHLDRYHQNKKPNQASTRLQVDVEEAQPLLFDLVEADNVEAVQALMPSFKKLTQPVRSELLNIAAACGSSSLLEMMCRNSDDKDIQDLARSAIKSKNSDTLEFIFQKCLYIRREKPGSADVIIGTLYDVLISESTDIYTMFKKYARTEFMLRTKDETKRAIASLRPFFSSQVVATARDPQKEQFLLNLWKDNTFSKSLKPEYLGEALSNIAQTCCSIRLARFLVDARANVDYRRSMSYPTPLHYAARKSSTEAAELMRFLLLCGANSKAYSQIGNLSLRRIEDERGARDTIKWLGISWDELITQTRDEIAEREEQERQIKEREELEEKQRKEKQEESRRKKEQEEERKRKEKQEEKRQKVQDEQRNQQEREEPAEQGKPTEQERTGRADGELERNRAWREFRAEVFGEPLEQENQGQAGDAGEYGDMQDHLAFLFSQDNWESELCR